MEAQRAEFMEKMRQLSYNYASFFNVKICKLVWLYDNIFPLIYVDVASRNSEDFREKINRTFNDYIVDYSFERKVDYPELAIQKGFVHEI